MTSADALTASLEDYLEAIFHIIAEKEAVRPKEIAKRLKVSNPSVTGALRALAEKGLINYAPYDVITLTPTGKTAAKDVVRRHEVLRDFFVKVLAVDEPTADKAACEMEHSIPGIILDRFIQFVEFVDTCPRGGSKWIAGFGYHCDHGGTQDNCEKCISVTLEEVKKRNQQGGAKTMAIANLKDETRRKRQGVEDQCPRRGKQADCRDGSHSRGGRRNRAGRPSGRPHRYQGERLPSFFAQRRSPGNRD